MAASPHSNLICGRYDGFVSIPQPIHPRMQSAILEGRKLMSTAYRFMIPALILCSAAPLRAAADAAADARKQIQALYNKENAAVMRGDAKAALANTAPDFISFGANGRKTTRAQMEQMMPQLMAMMKNLKAKTTVT